LQARPCGACAWKHTPEMAAQSRCESVVSRAQALDSSRLRRREFDPGHRASTRPTLRDLCLAPRRGRHADQTLEGARECGAAAVTDLERRIGHHAARVTQQPCPELHTPARQVLHGWLAEVLNESFMQSGT